MFRGAVHATLLATLAALNFVLATRLVWALRWNKAYSYRGHDHPLQLPLSTALPPVLLTVEESMNYPLDGFKSDDVWRSLGSSSSGYVRLNQPRPGDNVSHGIYNRLFALTMFHELHCLRMLNIGFNEVPVLEDSHLSHCLGYLRQMTLCDADLTPEPAGWEEKWGSSSNDELDGEEILDREGATHVCKNWNSIYDIVEENWSQWQDAKTVS